MSVPLIALAVALTSPSSTDSSSTGADPVSQPASSTPAPGETVPIKGRFDDETPWHFGLSLGPVALSSQIIFDSAQNGWGLQLGVHAVHSHWHSCAAASVAPDTGDTHRALTSLTLGTGVRADTDIHGSTACIFDFDGVIGGALLGGAFQHAGFVGFRMALGARFADSWTLKATTTLSSSLVTWYEEATLSLGYMF